MGFRRSIVLVTSSFLLGALLLGFPIFKAVCLEGRPTPEALLRLERYYGRWWEAPVAVKSLVHADMALSLIVVSTKLAEWTEEAFWFDGLSLLALVGCVAFYVAVLVPGLRDLNPQSQMSAKSFFEKVFRGAAQKVEDVAGSNKFLSKISVDEKSEKLGVLAAACVLCIVLLGLVISLQAGEWYATEKVLKPELEAFRKEQEALRTAKRE